MEPNAEVRRLAGANMDIDLTSPAEAIHWEQNRCPWNATYNS
ncbi:MAG: hypothetical protein Q7T82_08740 [Armatimonadota bacterium]|nr:hypothetical protein [Armatimonadota bacterium]